MKIKSDLARLTRYQSVVKVLLSKESFRKPDVYEILQDEKKFFIGQVISKLVQAGYITTGGSKSKPLYTWTKEKENFKAKTWTDQQVFTTTIKRSPSDDRPRERLLRLGPSKTNSYQLPPILIFIP